MWKKIWPECVNAFKGFPKSDLAVKEIVSLAHGAGFQEIEERDIVDLLQSHHEELTKEELMIMKQDRGDEN